MTKKQLKQKASDLGYQPAFPCRCVIEFSSGRKVNERPFDSGLTKREYFAGLAVQLKLSPVQGQKDDDKAQSRAIYAVKQADSLLMELVKEQQ